MEIGYAPSRIEGWLSLIECFSVEDGATSVDSFLNLKKSWQSYFCVLLVQEQKLLYCPSELAARRDIPLARGVNSIRLGDVKKSSEEHLPTTSHLMSNSAYEKGTDMGSSVSRGDGEPLSVDQNEDCQSTPSRIASFFGRKILRSQLKRTKSANKLDRRVSELPAERHHTLPAAPTTCSCTSSLTRTLSLRRKLRDNRPLSSDMTDPYTESTDTYSPLSSSKSQECLSASQATLQKVDLSGGGVEVRPLHSSLTGGQDHCFQLTTANSSTLYSCRTAKERQHWIQFIRKSIHPAQEQTRRIENSLNLWILEAKHVPGKKKYFCEFYLDKALYGRTSVKAMGDILFWGERFDFSHLPASETLTVHLYREMSKKRKKDSGRLLIGYLHVALSELKGSQAVERWFSMSSAVVGKDTRNATVPQVRLKARYMTTAVLPTILYADLIAYLQQHCQQLVDVLEPVLGIKAKDELASTLMNVMQRMNLATGFLTDIIVAEVARLDNNHLMFRGNSIATKAMETYMKLVGDKYIKDTLSDLTSIILQSSDCCEVDPAKVNGAATLSKHQESLTMYCDMIWLKIISSYHYFPRELQEVFHAVRKRCADINRADITDNLISSCIFLRCLCPAILSPSLWGLVQEFPDEKSIRTLTLIAKVIQTVANCSRFENKEYFMTFLNDFVEREVSNMKTFLHNISVEPKDSGNSFDGYIDLGRELSVLHAILSDSLNKLEDDKLISLKVILADISNHMNDPGKADKLVSNGAVLHDIFMTPSNAKQLGSSYSVNRTRSENGNHKKSRGAGKSPKYSTVEDYELVTTVDVQPTCDYLQPVVSSVLCHRPDPRADPSKVNESWNKIVSAADMVNGDYVDLISFIDDSEAHRRSMAFAAGNKPATERQFVQLPLNVQPSNTVPRTGGTTNSHTRATVSGPHSSVSSRGLTFTNPGFALPTSGYYSESVHVSRDHLSVSQVSLPRSQDSLYSRSYEKLNTSFQKASYMDSVCSNCGQQKEVSSTTLYSSENWQQQEVCSFCGSVWRQRHAGERVKTITSLPSPVDGFSTVSSDGRSSWRSSATPTHMKMGINSIERQRHDKSKLEYEQELVTLKDELARTQAMLAESQMKLKVAEERSQRSSESDDMVGPMRVERRRQVEPPGQRVRSLDAANSRLLAALSDLSEPHTNLLSGSIMTSTLL